MEDPIAERISAAAEGGGEPVEANVAAAGQGLIVEELRRQGLRCDGLDLSPKMIEYAS